MNNLKNDSQPNTTYLSNKYITQYKALNKYLLRKNRCNIVEDQ